MVDTTEKTNIMEKAEEMLKEIKAEILKTEDPVEKALLIVDMTDVLLQMQIIELDSRVKVLEDKLPGALVMKHENIH